MAQSPVREKLPQRNLYMHQALMLAIQRVEELPAHKIRAVDRSHQVRLLTEVELAAQSNHGHVYSLRLRTLIPELAKFDENKASIFSKRAMSTIGYVVLVSMPTIKGLLQEEGLLVTLAFEVFYEEYQKLASEK